MVTPDQLPDPSLAAEIGVVPYLLVLVTCSGVGTLALFLHRITKAMDRMAVAQEATPALLVEVKVLLARSMEEHGDKLDEAVDLAREHVRIAHMWERTEAPGRHVRSDPP